MESPTLWRFNFCLNGSSLVFWWRDAPLVCEFQCEVVDVNNGTPIDFKAVKCVSVVRLIFTTAISPDSCMQFTALDWLPSLPVDHSRQPVTLNGDRERIEMVSTVFFRKIFVLRIELIFFFIKMFSSNKIKQNEIKIQQNNTHFIDECAFGLYVGLGLGGLVGWGEVFQ